MSVSISSTNQSTSFEPYVADAGRNLYDWYAVLMGLAIAIVHSTLLLVIAASRHLRKQKELLVLAMNMVFDLLYGANHFTNSLRFVSMYYSGAKSKFVIARAVLSAPSRIAKVENKTKRSKCEFRKGYEFPNPKPKVVSSSCDMHGRVYEALRSVPKKPDDCLGQT